MFIFGLSGPPVVRVSLGFSLAPCRAVSIAAEEHLQLQRLLSDILAHKVMWSCGYC